MEADAVLSIPYLVTALTFKWGAVGLAQYRKQNAQFPNTGVKTLKCRSVNRSRRLVLSTQLCFKRRALTRDLVHATARNMQEEVS